MSQLDDEIRRWNADVEAEMARLIRRGVPPYEAARQAQRNVSERREFETRTLKDGRPASSAGGSL